MSNRFQLPARAPAFAICCLLAFLFLIHKTAAQNPPATSQPQAPAEKTVDEVQKNIQVLKGLPQSQLLPVMNYMATSLGVRCNYCHVNKGGVWDYAADEKAEKKSAREMITMVTGVNKSTFKGSPEVSCYTCHRGRTQVAHTIAFPLPTPEPRPSQQPPQGQRPPREALPTADQILDKYYQAIGGAAAVDKLKSRVMKGTLIAANGTEIGYELSQSGSDMVLAVLTTGQGVIERGFNGTGGWEKGPQGIRDLSGPEVYYLRRYPDMFKDIKLKEQFTRISVAGKPKIDGRDVYVLRATTPGGQRDQLYFDAETGFLIRRSTSMTTPVGVIPEQVEFSDYRDVDGLKIPFVVKVSAVDQNFSVTRKFTDVKVNAPVDPKRFSKPA